MREIEEHEETTENERLKERDNKKPADEPEDLRREVPKLVVSGSVYSQNPAQRMLIVNGQVVNEGASLGPELVLESIGPKSAVLRLRGVPFRLSY